MEEELRQTIAITEEPNLLLPMPPFLLSTLMFHELAALAVPFVAVELLETVLAVHRPQQHGTLFVEA